MFPAPRYPSLAGKILSLDDALPYARRAIQATGPGRLGVVAPGDRVLIVPPIDQDSLVLEAVLKAFRERGVEATAVPVCEIVGVSPDGIPLRTAAEGWREVFSRRENAALLGKAEEYLTSPESVEVAIPALGRYLKGHSGHTAAFAWLVGPLEGPVDRIVPQWKGSWAYNSREALASGAHQYPADVLDLVERKIVGLVSHIADVRVTDPAGTEVSFSVSREEAERWARGAWKPGHLLLHPFLATCHGSTSELVCARANGVIAGTSNHWGFYPHMKVAIEDGVVVGIEGGGEYGRLLRELMYRTKDIRYPGLPRPGYMYLSELALATCPKFCRDGETIFGTHSLFPNLEDTKRAGVFHWGFGLESHDPLVLKYGAEKGLPLEHGWHVHNYFSTYEVRLRDTGEWTTVLDGGHICALDDPEVGAQAAKHGDPEELLREDWVPAIPGINYPGDYLRDYGRDPVSWVWKEAQTRLPRTFGVP